MSYLSVISETYGEGKECTLEVLASIPSVDSNLLEQDTVIKLNDWWKPSLVVSNRKH